ncbi:DUF3109 family protein [Chlorobium ferrooxidans]|uniref:DUF3109 family protein n=1 Tax=Chlorobium ferrooxidans DSM 13031 TaxID=377431 RepID=Q0YT31_9CHLB|nr:DUF3109 family protein [Chlorobium ferrooxidans]EAT59433.1 conserved hypothetical protein [Chlorobium ferrooxidans DSM 13031]
MSLVSIGDVLVDRELLQAFFSCDLHECKGKCCVEGELGAPLTDAEAEALLHAPEELLRMIPEKNLKYLRRHGSIEIYQGRPYSRTIENRECVFSTVRDGITFCAIEIAFRDGLCDFDKPISCRLFPIRVRKKFGLDYLVYEQHAMCRSARKAGGELRIQLIDYVYKALEIRYGSDWVRSLKLFVDTSSLR